MTVPGGCAMLGRGLRLAILVVVLSGVIDFVLAFVLLLTPRAPRLEPPAG